MQQKMKRTLEAYMSALSELDIKKCVSYFAPDAKHRDPANSPLNNGRDAIATALNGMASLFAKLNINAVETYYIGNTAAVKWTATGSGKNGKKVSFTGIDLFEFNDHGQISNLIGYWDTSALAPIFPAK